MGALKSEVGVPKIEMGYPQNAPGRELVLRLDAISFSRDAGAVQ